MKKVILTLLVAFGSVGCEPEPLPQWVLEGDDCDYYKYYLDKYCSYNDTRCDQNRLEYYKTACLKCEDCQM